MTPFVFDTGKKGLKWLTFEGSYITSAKIKRGTYSNTLCIATNDGAKVAKTVIFDLDVQSDGQYFEIWTFDDAGKKTE